MFPLPPSHRSLTRRSLLRHGIAGTAAVASSPLTVGLRSESGLQRAMGAEPSDDRPLTFACIGMGGQMRGYLLQELAKLDQRVVAICDVDRQQLETAGKLEALAEARIYTDYRELLAEESGVDGVIIATPDHWHVPICRAALERGKHVYCEKPLAHSVAECRALERLALDHPGLATQTGNQGCSTEGFRRSYEVIRSGLLGPIREVHVWHPAHGWPSGVDRPADSDPIPPGLDWDFWLGTAPSRAYKAGLYHPGNWRGWYDFGGGSIADFCCHGFQLAFRALDLGAPIRIEATGVDLGHESFPTRCTIRYDFARKGERGPVTLFFHSGKDNLPPEEVTRGPVGTTGCLLVGSEGTLSAGLWNTDCQVRLMEEESFSGADHPAVAAIARTEPRIDTEALKWDPGRVAKGERPRWSKVNNSHMFEWVLACAGSTKTYSPFEVGARITELGMLGVLALRMEAPIEWDADTCSAIGLPGAASLIDPSPATTKYLPG